MAEGSFLRTLVLTSAHRLPDFSSLYEALGSRVDLEVRVLEKERQKNLRKALRGEDLGRYDRILLDLHFKNIHRQGGFLAELPGLLLYEEDACQNFLPHSRWHGAFSRLYAQIPHARILLTSSTVCRRLRSEGFDVRFFPKVYDRTRIYLEPRERDIELGFVGRTASSAYAGRREILHELAQHEPLQLLRAEPGADYRRTLNRIRYFVSADAGLSEYMAKNFEAMACGCVLLAWRQGEEESAIGLEDGRHLLLYGDVAELRERLAALRANPVMAQEIADAGRMFAEAHLTFANLAAEMARLLAEPLPARLPRKSGWRSSLQRLFSFPR